MSVVWRKLNCDQGRSLRGAAIADLASGCIAFAGLTIAASTSPRNVNMLQSLRGIFEYMQMNIECANRDEASRISGNLKRIIARKLSMSMSMSNRESSTRSSGVKAPAVSESRDIRPGHCHLTFFHIAPSFLPLINNNNLQHHHRACQTTFNCSSQINPLLSIAPSSIKHLNGSCRAEILSRNHRHQTQYVKKEIRCRPRCRRGSYAY